VSNFCEHCEGQRFDRAQVLRALRQIRSEFRARRGGKKVDEALALALTAIRTLDIPHLDVEEESGGDVVH
jgi:hypothetical protein